MSLTFNFDLTVDQVFPHAEILLDNIYYQENGISVKGLENRLHIKTLEALHKFNLQITSQPQNGDYCYFINKWIEGCDSEDRDDHIAGTDQVFLKQSDADKEKLALIWRAIQMLVDKSNTYWCEVYGGWEYVETEQSEYCLASEF